METLQISNGDIIFNSINRPLMIDGIEKLTQTIGEILSIEKQSNGFGAGLMNNTDNIQAAIYNSLNIFSQLQNKSIYQRTIDERYNNVSKLLVANKDTDVIFDLWFTNKAGTSLLVSQKIGG